MKWYFALNESSLKSSRALWEPMILAAVRSVQRNTTLRPYFIYDGGEDSFVTALETMGVSIIRHRVSFYDQLANHDPGNPGYLQTASGAFLRVEIPLVEQEDDFVLYTDCDVMFELDPVVKGIEPHRFACAPEFDKHNYTEFNTGVMIMNVPALREDLPAFTTFIGNNLSAFLSYDQDAYRQFYADQSAPLPTELNWKPYWGPSAQAQIVHFHGPALTGDLSAFYLVMGRPSIPPDMLQRVMLLQSFYSIRSERLLMERLGFDLRFRWPGSTRPRRPCGPPNAPDRRAPLRIPADQAIGQNTG